MKNQYSWPLNISTFTLWDKLKISKFLLTDDRWTQGEYVRKYEEKWESYTGVKHAIMVSSGSAANELIALRRKHELQKTGEWPRRNKVIFPAVTWISSVSPWINFGFEPVFMDVSGKNMNSTIEDVMAALTPFKNSEVGTVFYTSLLGFSQDLLSIKTLCQMSNIRLFLDNCESSFSRVFDENDSTHICAFATSSTSMYFSHLTTTGTEGGMIFTNEDEENDWFRMARSHGMTRNMPEKYKNKNVDPAFDFNILGSNYRSHNLAAFMGLLDFDRALKYSTDIDDRNSRIRVSEIFSQTLSDNFIQVHHQEYDDNVPLALPIVLSQKARPNLMKEIRELLYKSGIESRPLISGNLLRQTAFAPYGNPELFPSAEWLHHNACYVGLHRGVKFNDAYSLAKALNSISL